MKKTTQKPLTVGSRKSQLALWQTNFIIEELTQKWPALVCTMETFRTEGDEKIDASLPELGGKGLFTATLENAIREGAVDIAVHSLKDLPVDNSPGLTIGAITTRADARDVVVSRDGWTLETLPAGAVVGTSSTRRHAQVLIARPDVMIKPIRGNVETRIRKVMDGEYDAAILAAAGVTRLGIDVCPVEMTSFESMLPAPGQGALAIQCREDDEATLTILRAINHDRSLTAVTAERVFLSGLGGGCSAPVAAYARINERGVITMDGLVASTSGDCVVRVSGSGEDANELGARLAQEARSRGGAVILRDVVRVDAGATLVGKRIVVTRSSAQAPPLCDALTRLGARPIRVPVIRTEPIDDVATKGRVLEEVADADWVVFTSANGVDAVRRLIGSDGSFRGWLDETRVAVVGDVTERALAEDGVTAEFVPAVFTGAALADGLEGLNDKRVVLLRAADADQAIIQRLLEKGASVIDIPVYRTTFVPVEPGTLKRVEAGADAITFMSGVTAKALVHEWQQCSLRADRLTSIPAICVGPETVKTVRGLGFETCIVAEPHTTQGLVYALQNYFSEER